MLEELLKKDQDSLLQEKQHALSVLEAAHQNIFKVADMFQQLSDTGKENEINVYQIKKRIRSYLSDFEVEVSKVRKKVQSLTLPQMNIGENLRKSLTLD